MGGWVVVRRDPVPALADDAAVLATTAPKGPPVLDSMVRRLSATAASMNGAWSWFMIPPPPKALQRMGDDPHDAGQRLHAQLVQKA